MMTAGCVPPRSSRTAPTGSAPSEVKTWSPRRMAAKSGVAMVGGSHTRRADRAQILRRGASFKPGDALARPAATPRPATAADRLPDQLSRPGNGGPGLADRPLDAAGAPGLDLRASVGLGAAAEAALYRVSLADHQRAGPVAAPAHRRLLGGPPGGGDRHRKQVRLPRP